MPSVLAIVSKKVFAKDCAGLSVGDVWKADEYTSTHKALEPLANGGSLFLVTVRPPDEKLWLLAVLEAPKKSMGRWKATANVVPITDVSGLRSKIAFASGKGITGKKGALGMSLQTPRALSDPDVKLLRNAVGGETPTAPQTEPAPTPRPRPEPRPEPEAEPSGLVLFSEEAKKHLRPRTRAELPDPKPAKKLWRRWHDTFCRFTHYDPKHSGPLTRQVAAAQLMMLERSEPAELDVDTCSMAIVLTRSDDQVASSAYLCARAGPELAMRALLGSHRYEETLDGNTMKIVAVADGAEGDARYQLEVASALLRADDETRKRCAQIAEETWPTATLGMRGTLLACFPDRSDWAAEVAREWLGDRPRAGLDRKLFFQTLADAELVAAVAKRLSFGAAIVNVAANLGQEAVPLLSELLADAKYPNEQKSISRSLSCIGTHEAAAIFAKHLRKKHVRPYATEYFARFPHLAADALTGLAAKKTQVGAAARDILTRVERARVTAADDTVEEASDDEVPEILRSPPWHAEGRPKREPVVAPGLAVPDEPSRLHWTERQRRRYVAACWGRVGIMQSEEATAELFDKIARGDKAYFYPNHPADRAIPLLEKPPECLYIWNDTPVQMLALHGERALAGVLRCFEDSIHAGGQILLRIESPRLAAALARHKLHEPGWRAGGLAWIDRFPETAALGLVPVAVGDQKHARKGGEVGLRRLARLGHADLIRRIAKKHGSEALAAVDEILAWDERFDCPKKKPKMPAGYRPQELRRVLLKNGRALPHWAVERVGEMLRFSHTDEPYVGLAEVRDACEPRSLAEHAWDLAQAWDTDGAKDGQRWMLHAVAHFGDDEVVRRLTPALRGKGIADMLGNIGTDAALMELGTMLARARKSKTRRRPKSLWGTESAIQWIAAKRGEDPEDLEEKLTPTCDVDGEGGLTLDLGPRSYRVGFDQNLDPFLRDPEGGRVKALPRGGRDDDPKKVEAAHVVWTDLREDVAVIADQRSAAAERAMIDGRGWSVDAFRRVWIDHPLMIHMTRGIVWEARDERGETVLTFRVAEDRTFADRDDEPRELPAGTLSVGVPHAARWSAGDRARWREMLDDYDVLQPFSQLGREPVAFTEEQLASSEVAGAPFADRDALTAQLVRLGFITDRRRFYRPFPDGVYGLVTVEHESPVARVSVARDGAMVSFKDVGVVVRTELGRIAGLGER